MVKQLEPFHLKKIEWLFYSAVLQPWSLSALSALLRVAWQRVKRLPHAKHLAVRARRGPACELESAGAAPPGRGFQEMRGHVCVRRHVRA